MFRIVLHIDDIGVLHTIQDRLNFGKVTQSGDTASFLVNAFDQICELVTIFDKFSLLTHKQLDYKNWKEAIELKKLSGRSLSSEAFYKIQNLKNSMNASRVDFSGYNVSQSAVADFWLLGFVEGDGSFHVSNNAVVFSIKQKDKTILEQIAIYLQNLTLSPPYND